MKALYLIILICAVSYTYAQTDDSLIQDSISTESKVFFEVEQQAEFPGGLEGMKQFLKENYIYPAKAKKKKIQGKVFVKFIVEKNGALSNIEVLKGVSPILDNEAIRLVSVSPSWIPARQNGEIVRSQFVLPINFLLY